MDNQTLQPLFLRLGGNTFHINHIVRVLEGGDRHEVHLTDGAVITLTSPQIQKLKHWLSSSGYLLDLEDVPE